MERLTDCCVTSVAGVKNEFGRRKMDTAQARVALETLVANMERLEKENARLTKSHASIRAESDQVRGELLRQKDRAEGLEQEVKTISIALESTQKELEQMIDKNRKLQTTIDVLRVSPAAALNA